MFEWSKEMMNCIINKKEISKNHLMTIERALRLYDASEDMLNYQIGLPNEDNKYELTMRCE